MDRIEQIPPHPETITATSVPAIGEIVFTDTNDSVIHISSMTPKAAQNFSDQLAHVYLTLGPGEHAWHQAFNQLEDKRILPGIMSRFGEYMPREAYTDTGSSIIFGRLALAERLPTEEEQSAFKAKRKALKIEKAEARRAQLEEADEHKIHLSTYDHAMVMIGEKLFYLPFIAPESLLAARALQKISSVPDSALGDYNSLSSFANQIWEEMPIAERAQFAQSEEGIYTGRGTVLEESLQRLFYLTASLNVTRRGSIAAHFKVLNNDITVALEAVPPTIPYDRNEATPLIAPGVPPETFEASDPTKVTPQDLEKARFVIEKYRAGICVSHADALEMLDVVMSRQGKQALLQVLPEGVSDADTLLQNIHKLILQSLGSGYWSARRARTIAGNIVTGSNSRVALVSGGLPGTTKWFIGL